MSTNPVADSVARWNILRVYTARTGRLLDTSLYHAQIEQAVANASSMELEQVVTLLIRQTRS